MSHLIVIAALTLAVVWQMPAPCSGVPLPGGGCAIGDPRDAWFGAPGIATRLDTHEPREKRFVGSWGR